jgi:hypothetical protein
MKFVSGISAEGENNFIQFHSISVQFHQFHQFQKLKKLGAQIHESIDHFHESNVPKFMKMGIDVNFVPIPPSISAW